LTRPAKTQFHSNVELEITYQQQLNYNPPKGINVLFYDRKNTQKAKDRVNATFLSTSINNEINAQKYLHDINAELALLGKFVKKDHLKKSDEPQLIRNPAVKTDSILDTSIFKHSRDSVISRAKNRHTIKISPFQLKEINKKFDKPLKDVKKDKDGFYKADFGQITD
jgi:hypothetical protein